MGVVEHRSTSTRRAVAAGLTASLLFRPPARAQVQSVQGAAPPFIPASQPDPAASVVRTTDDDSDRMTVPVLLNGQGPFPFVVDTGSNRTVVSDVLAAQLDLPMSQALQVHAATGVVSTGSVRVASLAVGARSLKDFDAPVLLARNLGALGMLGIDAVSGQRIELDFHRSRMTLTASRHAVDDPGAVVVKAHSKYGQLLLVDSWVEGIPLYVVIDTGSETTIANSVLRAILARRRAAYPQPVQVTSVTGDTIEADLSLMPEVRLGNVFVRNLQVAYADLYVFNQFGLQAKPSMLLGMSTLRCFDKVSIDFPGRAVRFLLKGG